MEMFAINRNSVIYYSETNPCYSNLYISYFSEPWSAVWRKLPQFGRQGGIKETHSIAVEVSPGQMTIPERNVANVLQPSGSLNGPGVFQCPNCGNYYKYKRNMLAHLKLECGMEPQFQCQFCPCRYKQKSKLQIHVGSKHRNKVSAFLKL